MSNAARGSAGCSGRITSPPERLISFSNPPVRHCTGASAALSRPRVCLALAVERPLGIGDCTNLRSAQGWNSTTLSRGRAPLSSAQQNPERYHETLRRTRFSTPTFGTSRPGDSDQVISAKYTQIGTFGALFTACKIQQCARCPQQR